MNRQTRFLSQEQFLDVVDRDHAEQLFLGSIDSRPLGDETVPLTSCLGRILSKDVRSKVDVPSFDRANLDGFAIRAVDSVAASEESPRRFRLTGETIPTAVVPTVRIQPQDASPIATGGMLPRGADAVVMIEHTEMDGDELLVRRPVAAGNGISFAGTDIGAGETILRQGDRLTSRETGVLAAIGHAFVCVYRKPRVAIVSTGDEIIDPTSQMKPGLVYDSNMQILADAITELGGTPVRMGVVNDDLCQLRQVLGEALEDTDVILLSGGTSKGDGDLSFRAVSELDDPGVIAHGVALKPGKPICLAASRKKPVVILPGFPTSAVFTFHEFVAPVVRKLAGATVQPRDEVQARMAVKVNSEIGRTEYLLVGLVEDFSQNSPVEKDFRRLSAYPMGKGSGSVTTFSHADGFVTIDRHEEIVNKGDQVRVQLLGHQVERADLVMIGSHCVGADFLLGELQQRGFRSKFLAVGSIGGLAAVERGECDVAGIHLLDAEKNVYNRPFLRQGMTLLPGYRRQQGILFRRGDAHFEGTTAVQAIQNALTDPTCAMVNRNRGSGTRVIIDKLLGSSRPEGYAIQPKSHNAVAAAVAQHRADWGIAIQGVAETLGLGFIPLAEEDYDFVVPDQRINQPAVSEFIRLLESDSVRKGLEKLGFKPRQTAF